MDPTPRPDRRKETVAKKFTIAFATMFVVPMLLAVYLLADFSQVIERDAPQVAALFFFASVLAAAGFLICRSVVRALLTAVRDAEAVAGGDVTHRMDTGSAGEISDLAKNFNRITTRLQQTIDGLEASRKQIQTLLSKVCGTIGQPVEIESTFDVLLQTLVSVTGLPHGAIFLLSPDGKTLTVSASVGIPQEERETVLTVGRGVVGWVAYHGQIVTTAETAPWGGGDGLSRIEKLMSRAVHVPLGAPGKVKGVLSLGLGGDQKEICADDHLMIRNLAAQVSVAIENAALKEDMEKTYVETVAALAAAVEARDKYTKGHSRRVTELSVALARSMGLSAQACKDIEAAALLHDIGKIGIPDSILHNAGPLPPEGLRYIHDHPIGGENILKPVGSLGRLCPIVRHHHEHYDGGGYPDRLRGEQIPLAARILAVADSYDAMISDRSYKPARTSEEAIEELRRCRGTLFDPECVDAFVACCRDNAAAASRCPT